MQPSRLALIRGALIQAKAIRSRLTQDTLTACGITPDEWHTFLQPEWWTGPEARQAGMTVNKALSIAFELSGTPRIGVIAEYIAAVIATLVQPVNWSTACSVAHNGLDGSKLLTPEGDEVTARETVTPERLYALVLAAADVKAKFFRPDPEAIADTTQEAEG